MSMRTGERSRVPASPHSTSETQDTAPLAIRDGPSMATSSTSPVSNISQVSQQEHLQQHHHQQQQRGRRLSEKSSEHCIDLQDEMWLFEGSSDSDNLVDYCFDVAIDFGVASNLTDLATGPTLQSTAMIPTPITEKYDGASLFEKPLNHGLQQSKDVLPMAYNAVGSARSGSSTYSDDGISRRARIHDCTLEVLEIVSDFHALAQGCLTAVRDPACTAHPEHPLDDDTPREMGTVLRHNREILHKLNKLLECRCFMRQEVLVLAYVAVYKALGWYAAVLGDDGSSEEDQSHCPLFGRIAITASFVGSYCLDSDSQRVVAAHLVLTHLWEHVDPLIKRLRDWHPSAATHATKGHMSNIIDQHHQALQAELERITFKAKSIKHT
ncbi:Sterigmatocystin biosynthesis regulatory protein [Colletotrichum higginsianum]|uniref:Sterigmatocystin biosynthesis regulatory protein n=1 Tax=Colletotrichum higginsianum TaxID=80884 RepID=A0A4T0VGQ8_9PEZI|nr:Sterigmatocystin biosynthesis regulatory protein [Colletotrichum higginsianum]